MRLLFTSNLVGLVLLLCAASAAGSHDADTRIEDVLAHPDLYNGKRVTLNAWITLRDEDQNLWVSWNDHEHWEPRKCISLTNYDVLSGKSALLDGRHVKVTGIVRSDASKKGGVIRLAACRDLALDLIDASSVEVADPKEGK